MIVRIKALTSNTVSLPGSLPIFTRAGQVITRDIEPEEYFSIKADLQILINAELISVETYTSDTKSRVSIIAGPYEDIDSDDFDTVNLEIFVKSDASNIINFPVKIRYRDATNEQFTITETVLLKTYTVQDAMKLGLLPKPNYTIYIIIIVFVIAFFIYRKIKKRRKRKLSEIK